MRYILIAIGLFLFQSCQKEISCENCNEEAINKATFKIIGRGQYPMQGGYKLPYIQIGGTLDVGWYGHELETYFLVVHDSMFQKYIDSSYITITPNK